MSIKAVTAVADAAGRHDGNAEKVFECLGEIEFAVAGSALSPSETDRIAGLIGVIRGRIRHMEICAEVLQAVALSGHKE